MTRRTLFTIIVLISAKFGAAQQLHIDSLKREIGSKNDTTNLILLEKIANTYSEINPDSALLYAMKMLVITKKLDLKLEEVVALGEMGYALLNLGNYPRSLQTLLTGISIAEDAGSEKNILPALYPVTDDFTDRTLSPRMQRLTILSRILQYAGILYSNSGHHEKSLHYHRMAIPLAKESKNLRVLSITYTSLGRTYLALKQTDSALLSFQKAHDYAIKAGYKRYLGSVLLNLGRVYLLNGDNQTAINYFQRALMESAAHNYYRGIVATHLVLADIHKQAGKADSSLHHLRSGLLVANTLNTADLLLRCYVALADFYKRFGNNDSTVKFQSLIIKINDSLFNSKQVQHFQNIDFDAQQKQQEIQAANKEYKDRMQKYLLIGGLAVFLIIAVLLWRNNRQRQKSNAVLQQHNKEIENAMANLKATQAQLVQSEKMASLGELTAGIAHEIQNPLNFVNNFSEVSSELLDEMITELGNDNKQDAIAIADDVKQNLEKILHHGKQADGIVKGMLQHSRSSSAVKEPTDINKLADEYLRLAFHGLRAKDKSFNAILKTDYDDTIGTINIIPQDIGRVILNLITNAFYAVTEKKKQQPDYEPIVTVTTKRLGSPPAGGDGGIEIKVSDNGNGIPPKVLDKIFQPFFTTKPTGQGTGLGLSLSYDIVKAHGGELKVETKEGQWAEFIIQLPVA